jgi:pimeloyl-ACP methyl ester carboxylesterase
MTLSVSQHVEDLHQLLLSRCIGEKPNLIGSSWGAMLALAYAEKYSDNMIQIKISKIANNFYTTKTR